MSKLNIDQKSIKQLFADKKARTTSAFRTKFFAVSMC